LVKSIEFMAPISSRQRAAGSKQSAPFPTVEIVYPNPDFYDKSLPPWEAQSLCISVSAGPRSRENPLYPPIVNIWNSLDWDALAAQLK